MVLPTDTGRNRCRVTATSKVEMTMLKFGIFLSLPSIYWFFINKIYSIGFIYMG